MQKFNRRFASLSILAALAACGKSEPLARPAPQFKRYFGPPVTQVAVYKAKRRMHLLNGKTVLKSYDFGLGNQPVGHKQFEGDGKTPEGLYFIDRFNPRSRYHLSVGISYPNERDKAYAAQFGRSAGGDIMFHGRGPEGNLLAPAEWDWTAGCITVTDEESEDIYAMLKIGTPVWLHA
ncbi:MAG: L,D-transpeptidase family protein [Alphaproteobacteria bacterium]|jgi:murein L,D-transpeptidase YafK|uniref:L,D-transpeptidase family protein n=1 Tax=Loktanella salsilacus TaxID=195913 RepID=UPI001EC8BE27|nr:L,D-transpeptidase family protein [Alphaproteobacteria bacterium]MBU0862718.1 L,D-transpeptidase family protein [Alphaproteobacteria bacterium]MBU1836479.1 L,D-transpeptidase family protein [Alphaproteobacteria bacterium]|tara:strand:- start:5239 stop:5772 length:534 start_codon:yes stop_codon:yes gene_type:complete